MKIQFKVIDSLAGHVLRTLLGVGTKPEILVSHADTRIGAGALMHFSFVPPSEETFDEVKGWLDGLEAVQQVFDIEGSRGDDVRGVVGFGVV